MLRSILIINKKQTSNLIWNKFYSKTVAGRELKRFYNDVTISESYDNQKQQKQLLTSKKYEINLDKRKLKTPNGKLFHVDNETLVHMIAHEWKIQESVINKSSMHLTTLANTCIDNPLNLNSKHIIGKLVDYLQTDTLLFRDNSNNELIKKQEQQWQPLINWMNEKYPQLKLTTKVDIELNSSTFENSKYLENYLNNFNLNALIALNFMCETLKSLIVSIALVERHIDDVNVACELALLEQMHQTSKWGKVEWHHNFEEVETKTRVAASLLFIYYNLNTYNSKSKI